MQQNGNQRENLAASRLSADPPRQPWRRGARSPCPHQVAAVTFTCYRLFSFIEAWQNESTSAMGKRIQTSWARSMQGTAVEPVKGMEGKTGSRWGKHEGRERERRNSCFFTALQLSFRDGCAIGRSKHVLQVFC